MTIETPADFTITSPADTDSPREGAAQLRQIKEYTQNSYLDLTASGRGERLTTDIYVNTINAQGSLTAGIAGTVNTITGPLNTGDFTAGTISGSTITASGPVNATGSVLGANFISAPGGDVSSTTVTTGAIRATNLNVSQLITANDFTVTGTFTYGKQVNESSLVVDGDTSLQTVTVHDTTNFNGNNIFGGGVNFNGDLVTSSAGTTQFNNPVTNTDATTLNGRLNVNATLTASEPVIAQKTLTVGEELTANGLIIGGSSNNTIAGTKTTFTAPVHATTLGREVSDTQVATTAFVQALVAGGGPGPTPTPTSTREAQYMFLTTNPGTTNSITVQDIQVGSLVYITLTANWISRPDRQTPSIFLTATGSGITGGSQIITFLPIGRVTSDSGVYVPLVGGAFIGPASASSITFRHDKISIDQFTGFFRFEVITA